MHPLKLWLVGYLQEHPTTTRAAMLEAGAGARQDSYAWLFRTKHKRAQDRRIRILLEEEAFVRIHEAGAGSATRSISWWRPTPPRSAAPPTVPKRSPN